MSRTITLALILIFAASTLVMVRSASASATKPSVPEFTVRYVDQSYDVDATYSTDPYTGKTVMTSAETHVQNSSVEIIIKNQPYTSYRNENGSLIWLYYRTAIKGHFEDWQLSSEKWASQSVSMKTYESYPAGYLPSDDSQYTVITFGLAGDNGTDTAYKYRTWTYNDPPFYGYYFHRLENVSVGGQVDFRVQAIVGYSTRINETFSGPPIGLDPGDTYHYYIFTGETSEWSSTHTLAIGENTETIETSSPPLSTPTPHATATPSPTSTPSLNPTATPTQTAPKTDVLLGLDWQTVVIVVLVVVVAVLAVGLVALWRRLPKK